MLAGAVALTDDQLAGLVCHSELAPACNLRLDVVRPNIQDWRANGATVVQNLKLTSLDSDALHRIYQYYLPVHQWVKQQLAQHREAGAPGPLVVGISAPQGCGKSTLVEQLESLLVTADGLRVAAVSIDDFYLRHSDLAALAAMYDDNRLLAGRGHAGTHDVALGEGTLRRLAELGAGETVALPRYDKSAHGGAGDRAPESGWPTVTGPLDVVLFEGWMLGFAPVGAEAAAAVEPGLALVDELLGRYRAAWDARVHAWLVIEVEHPTWVHAWRLEAEQRMRAAGRGGMSDGEVAAFVERYMPAYRAYLPGLYRDGPTTARPGHWLRLAVAADRSLMSAVAM